MSSIEEIKATAISELEERFNSDPEMQYPEDMVSEIADSSVPIYTYELALVAQSSMDVMLHENELPPAFDGTPTITNQIATAIYEIVQEELYERLYELQQEHEVQQDNGTEMEVG
ncbi:hypothetical protein Ga0123461_1739 [Mariprofundus aestuarium]|uniref:Uncharacterized protein n=1 Tax=Mariprofundus aestuarium TaxID=1921086 RepID=A0A2K8KZC4_MARES|nr:hypothetical protein [Mariprofundus aestuarium]ATX80152.1 hypothetical protein Ga0123461_1739 [Mariprofundus aestuarium]